MTFTIPESANQYGFITSGMGAHTGRTIMFRDLYALLGVGSSESSLEDYRNSILTENVLLKPTESARNEAFRRLKQLYGLDQRITVFRSLRMLWDQAEITTTSTLEYASTLETACDGQLCCDPGR